MSRIARVLHLFWFDCVAQGLISFRSEHFQAWGCHSLHTHLVPLFDNPYKHQRNFLYIESEFPIQAVLFASHNKKPALSFWCFFTPQQKEESHFNIFFKVEKLRSLIHLFEPCHHGELHRNYLCVSAYILCQSTRTLHFWVISPVLNTGAGSVPDPAAVTMQVHPKIQGLLCCPGALLPPEKWLLPPGNLLPLSAFSAELFLLSEP